MDHTTQRLLVEAMLGSALLLWAATWLSLRFQPGRPRREQPQHDAK
jgi:hypothetical protein